MQVVEVNFLSAIQAAQHAPLAEALLVRRAGGVFTLFYLILARNELGEERQPPGLEQVEPDVRSWRRHKRVRNDRHLKLPRLAHNLLIALLHLEKIILIILIQQHEPLPRHLVKNLHRKLKPRRLLAQILPTRRRVLPRHKVHHPQRHVQKHRLQPLNPRRRRIRLCKRLLPRHPLLATRPFSLLCLGASRVRLILFPLLPFRLLIHPQHRAQRRERILRLDLRLLLRRRRRGYRGASFRDVNINDGIVTTPRVGTTTPEPVPPRPRLRLTPAVVSAKTTTPHAPARRRRRHARRPHRTRNERCVKHYGVGAE